MKCYCFITLIVSVKSTAHLPPEFRNVVNDDEAAGYALRLKEKGDKIALDNKDDYPGATVVCYRYDVSDTIIERVAAMAVQGPNP